MDSMNPDGTNIAERLKQEITVVSMMPFDDSIAETPHAQGNAIVRKSRSAGFPWIAATMRLKQNLSDVKLWSQALECDQQLEWNRYKSILQVKPSLLHRNVRLPQAEFRSQVYVLGRFSRAIRDPLPHGHESADPNPDEFRQASCQPEAPDDIRRDEPDADVGGDLVHGPQISQQSLSLMREYLLACLKPGQWISFPRLDHDGDKVPVFAQVLGVETKVTTVPTCTPNHVASRSFLSVATTGAMAGVG